MNRKMNLSLALVLAAALSASPAVAQKGHGNNKGGKHEDRVERRDENRGRQNRARQNQVRRNDDRWDDNVTLQRRSNNNVRTGRRQGVPPGWCIGRGNPHNTVANCGVGAGRYDPRYDDRIYTGGGRYEIDRDRYSGSYAQQHADYHAWHDRQCRSLSAQRPLDLVYQIRIRAQCKAEHDAWHRQTGTRH